MDFLGLGSSLLGGALSFLGGKKDRDSAAQQALQNYLHQKEFAQHGIRWRVEDAKAAGLHPLYALGGASATFSPNPIVTNFGETFGRMGQDVSRAARAALSPQESSTLELQKDLLRAQVKKTEAESAALESRAARDRQEALGGLISVSPGSDVVDPVEAELAKGNVVLSKLKDHGLGIGQVQELPPRSDAWITQAEPKAAWDRYAVGPSQEMLLPSGSNMSEALESVQEGLILGALIVSMNAKHYGPGWLDSMAHHFGVSGERMRALAAEGARAMGSAALEDLKRLGGGVDSAIRRGMEWGRQHYGR